MNLLEQAYSKDRKKSCFFFFEDDSCIRPGKEIPTDWNPRSTVNIEPWHNLTHTLALAFGCEKTFTSDGKEWIKNLLSSPEQVYDLKMPELHNGRTGEILDKALILTKELPQDVMIRLPDIQSPLGVAELIWDESFYIALLTNPEEIHHLLKLITGFTVNYINEFKRITGKSYNPSTHPQVWSSPEGYYISDDVNSMVSPEMHLEYSINYINILTEKLGPVHYHSCTWTPQYFENIRKLKDVKSANWSFGTSSDPAVLLKEFSLYFPLCAHIGIDTHNETGILSLGKNIHSAFDLTRYMIENMTEDTTLLIWFMKDICQDAKMINEIRNYLLNEGFGPGR